MYKMLKFEHLNIQVLESNTRIISNSCHWNSGFSGWALPNGFTNSQPVNEADAATSVCACVYTRAVPTMKEFRIWTKIGSIFHHDR